jgi:two-component system OmpR family response regulator
MILELDSTPPPPGGAGQPVPVLMVEDSKNVQQVLADLFHAIGGFRIVACITTEMEATAWLQQHRGDWQLATIDLVLHEGSGFNLIQRCKAAHEGGHVVVLSDFVTPAIEERCRAMGADAVFNKADVKGLTGYLEALLQR